MNTGTEENLKNLFKTTFNESIIGFEALPTSGSERRYFRIKSAERSVIGAFNKDEKENRAFINFTNHFDKIGLNVPSIIASDYKQNIYLINDLGDITLFSQMFSEDERLPVSEKTIGYYKQALQGLIRFQLEGGKNLDWSVCYPRDSFDRQSMQWDLNYFKYYFLKLKNISFDEQKLEDDFSVLMDYLLTVPSGYFMYRDFQARNIMVNNNALWFIDYQGGRKGPLQYDLASILFQAKADLPLDCERNCLAFILMYLKSILRLTAINSCSFIQALCLYAHYRFLELMVLGGIFSVRHILSKALLSL